jgi:poly-gamma-glutamate synthesis protein (capsule biosynthesis protein)
MLSSRNLTFGLSVPLLALFISSLPLTSIPEYEVSTDRRSELLALSLFEEERNERRVVSEPYTGIVFVGDILLARNVEIVMNQRGLLYPFEGLQLSSKQHHPAIVGNFESSVPLVHRTTPAYAMQFSTHSQFLPVLKQAGFTHLSLANNHSFDFAATGYQNTVESLVLSEVVPFGHNSNVDNTSITYIDTIRGTVALVAINAVSHKISSKDIDSVMQEAKRNSVWQIVYPHWGDEYVLSHNKAQKSLATTLVSLGADLIVGHHPHVVQDVDVIDGVIVFYSLGNYIFDQYFSANVQRGLVLSINLSDEPTLSLVPVTSEGHQSQPRPMTPPKAAMFLVEIADRSHRSLQSEIRAGKMQLSSLVATSTEMAMIVE